MILQRQQAQPLAAHAQRPVRQPARVHRVGRLAAERLDHRDLVLRSGSGPSQVAVLDQVRHQRVQPVHRDELLRES